MELLVINIRVIFNESVKTKRKMKKVVKVVQKRDERTTVGVAKKMTII